MARIRSIKPEFFLHEGLTELSPLHRLLFIGLWCLADKRGRLEDRPKRVKIEVLPWDDCDLNRILQDLHDAGFILRYEVEGLRLIQIIAFEKHQRISGKEAQNSTVLPSPPTQKNSEAQVNESGSDGEAPGKYPGAQERSTDNGERSTECSTSNTARKPPAKKTNPDAGRLCELLADLVAANGSKRPDVSDPWLLEMDRLIRLDKRDPSDIEAVIRWSQADGFWRANILSAKKLRDQFDRLRLQAERQNALSPRQLSPMTTPSPSRATPEPLHIVALREWTARGMSEQGVFPTYLEALKDVNTWPVERLEAERERWIA